MSPEKVQQNRTFFCQGCVVHVSLIVVLQNMTHARTKSNRVVKKNNHWVRHIRKIFGISRMHDVYLDEKLGLPKVTMFSESGYTKLH